MTASAALASVEWRACRSTPVPKDTPSSATQLAAALAALGLYRGANTSAEHAAEARRLGGEDPYRVQLANALLGAAQTEALLADALGHVDILLDLLDAVA